MSIDYQKEGKIHWPIPMGDEVSVPDAYATLFEISDGSLDVSFWDKDGEAKVDYPTVSIGNEFGGLPAHFFHEPLKDLLERALDWLIEDENEDDPRAVMLNKLIDVIDGKL